MLLNMRTAQVYGIIPKVENMENMILCPLYKTLYMDWAGQRDPYWYAPSETFSVKYNPDPDLLLPVKINSDINRIIKTIAITTVAYLLLIGYTKLMVHK